MQNSHAMKPNHTSMIFISVSQKSDRQLRGMPQSAPKRLLARAHFQGMPQSALRGWFERYGRKKRNARWCGRRLRRATAQPLFAGLLTGVSIGYPAASGPRGQGITKFSQASLQGHLKHPNVNKKGTKRAAPKRQTNGRWRVPARTPDMPFICRFGAQSQLMEICFTNHE